MTEQVRGPWDPRTGPAPRNHLALSIVSVVLGFLPLGVVAVVFAARVDGLWARGEREQAMSSSKTALWCSVVSLAIGVLTLLGFLLLFLFLVAVGASDPGSSSGYGPEYGDPFYGTAWSV